MPVTPGPTRFAGISCTAPASTVASAGVALGAPEPDTAQETKRKTEAATAVDKKSKIQDKGSKRAGESLDDLYWDQLFEASGAGGASGSAATRRFLGACCARTTRDKPGC